MSNLEIAKLYKRIYHLENIMSKMKITIFMKLMILV